ncbi:site-specific integrase [Muricauda sp. 334s03]|uniref:Site-specific integrase n=1 Tax=Flagellimonas yonaguniensis TaxID=3031325 RepID=A0ABT5Y0H0_9FLAO|nr:site-specific integrase [[Muricauda] yonaguniensis]MDF0716941.1 site-specific integrase [[Muricauda] yonaguniensis]
MFGPMNILFYPKKMDSDTDGKVTIYTRITVNGKRSEFSLRRRVEERKWDRRAGKLRGTAPKVANFNRFLENVKNRCFEVYDNLLKEREDISATMIRDTYLGKGKNQHMLLEIFDDHNREVESLIGRGFAKGTLQRYNAARRHVFDYIQHAHQRKDIPVKKVDHKFITGLEYFLRFKKNCNHNTTVRYIVNFKKIIRIAYANQWIERDPFFHWKASWKHKERQYLTQEELTRIFEKEFDIVRLQTVKDIFLFCCYTGLAFVDVEKLNKDHIVKDIKGQKWIKTHRQKTKVLSSIPLLSIPEAIIEKYKDHPRVVAKGTLLPVYTNQRTNFYLKEIAIGCKINKTLTTHLARHTFATTVTLSNGVSIESVSKMLGHTSLKTTQIYAKVLDSKISDDMEKLKNDPALLEFAKSI